jgi:hypothetical protein
VEGLGAYISSERITNNGKIRCSEGIKENYVIGVSMFIFVVVFV